LINDYYFAFILFQWFIFLEKLILILKSYYNFFLFFLKKIFRFPSKKCQILLFLRYYLPIRFQASLFFFKISENIIIKPKKKLYASKRSNTTIISQPISRYMGLKRFLGNIRNCVRGISSYIEIKPSFLIYSKTQNNQNVKWPLIEVNILIFVLLYYMELNNKSSDMLEEQDWILVADLVLRSPKECKIKWSNLMKSRSNKKSWTSEEDQILSKIIR